MWGRRFKPTAEEPFRPVAALFGWCFFCKKMCFSLKHVEGLQSLKGVDCFFPCSKACCSNCCGVYLVCFSLLVFCMFFARRAMALTK